jgi:polar amino acid transport system substrate-binding protein
MGLTAEFENIGFDGLIPALQAGQCDAIISSLYDKPTRREVVDFVDYAIVGNAVIARSDSPLFVQDLQGLSGKKLSVERGSVNEQEAVEANTALQQGGKPPITIVTLPKMSDAIQQMVTGLTDGFYGGTATVAIYNMTNKGAVKLASPQTISFATGIATVKAFRTFELFLYAALWYLLLTTVLGFGQRSLERRMARHEAPAARLAAARLSRRSLLGAQR